MARPVYVVSKMRRAALIALVVVAAGCGGGGRHAQTTTVVRPVTVNAKPGLRVGVVGPLDLRVAGASIDHGRTLEALAHDSVVIVPADRVDLATVAAAAEQNPATHYAYLGGSTKGSHRTNLVGIVLRDDQAALLGGVVAGLVLEEQGGREGRVAWVGPQEQKLADAYAEGVHRVVPDAVVLHGWSKRQPARCKEAALATLVRGAVVVTAHGGLCAEAAASAAHDQNRIALSLEDFEVPAIPAAAVVRDAVAGVFHGGEDLVFGVTSGAIAVASLDARISPDTAIRARSSAQELANGLRVSG